MCANYRYCANSRYIFLCIYTVRPLIWIYYIPFKSPIQYMKVIIKHTEGSTLAFWIRALKEQWNYSFSLPIHRGKYLHIRKCVQTLDSYFHFHLYSKVNCIKDKWWIYMRHRRRKKKKHKKIYTNNYNLVI